MAHAARALPSFEALYREIIALPTGVTGEILERGVLRTMSRPGTSHRLASKRAGRDLEGFDRNLGGTGGWIGVEAEVRLLDEYLAVPDLAGWRVERVPELPDENPIPIAPDWACEILSPTTARDDRRLKLPLYARAGVGWIWLLDTEARQVEIYETVGDRATFAFAAAERAKLPPFDHAFDVATWFASPAIASATAAKRSSRAKRAAKTARPRQR
jgi:Uma2 family endonuclease